MLDGICGKLRTIKYENNFSSAQRKRIPFTSITERTLLQYEMKSYLSAMVTTFACTNYYNYISTTTTDGCWC